MNTNNIVTKVSTNPFRLGRLRSSCGATTSSHIPHGWSTATPCNQRREPPFSLQASFATHHPYAGHELLSDNYHALMQGRVYWTSHRLPRAGFLGKVHQPVLERYKNGCSTLENDIYGRNDSLSRLFCFTQPPKALFNMASLGNASPTHNQSFLFDQMPLLDLFFPGLGPATSPA